jgi:hypothetical protein
MQASGAITRLVIWLLQPGHGPLQPYEWGATASKLVPTFGEA